MDDQITFFNKQMSFRSKLSRANKHSIYDLIQKRNSYLEKNLSNNASALNTSKIGDTEITRKDLRKLNQNSGMNLSSPKSPTPFK